MTNYLLLLFLIVLYVPNAQQSKYIIKNRLVGYLTIYHMTKDRDIALARMYLDIIARSSEQVKKKKGSLLKFSSFSTYIYIP